MGVKAKKFKRFLGHYFNVIPDKEDEMETILNINHGIRFRGANLWILVFGIFLASLGLNIDSTAVVIGAMLVSPIMGPILGMGLALGIKDYAMLRRSIQNYAVAMIISVVTATLYFLLTPYQGAQSELFARTSPTLYDVAIAFFGGMAGIFAVCTKGKGNVLPGVAIATALMPPLCTAGYGLATAHWSYFFGAFYLFFINTIFIGLATFVGVKMLRFKVRRAKASETYHNIGKYLAVGVILSLIPAAVMTYRIVRDGLLENKVMNYIHQELEKPGVQIFSHKVNRDKKTLEVVAVGRKISEMDLGEARQNMDNYNLEDYALKVVQGDKSDSLLRLGDRMASAQKKYYRTLELLQIQSEEIVRLNKRLYSYQHMEDLSEKVKKEVNVLFPEVADVMMASDNTASADSLGGINGNLVVVVQMKDSLSQNSEKEKIVKWLETRLDNAKVMVTFPSEAVAKMSD